MERESILNQLDLERQHVVFPGVERIYDKGVVRDLASDGKSSEIVYCSCSEDDVDAVVTQQIQDAESSGYDLEWKLYGHDRPACLAQRLQAAGFTSGDMEQFMVFAASDKALARFGPASCEIRRVTDRSGLADVELILDEVAGQSAQQRIDEYAFMLERYPDNLSFYIAYLDGVPASCGRVYFHKDSKFAALYGGQTRVRFRRQGLFTQIVAARIREAMSRGIAMIYVDALPTSEPIFRKLGFVVVTGTRPYFFKPGVRSV